MKTSLKKRLTINVNSSTLLNNEKFVSPRPWSMRTTVTATCEEFRHPVSLLRKKNRHHLVPGRNSSPRAWDITLSHPLARDFCVFFERFLVHHEREVRPTFTIVISTIWKWNHLKKKTTTCQGGNMMNYRLFYTCWLCYSLPPCTGMGKKNGNGNVELVKIVAN